MPTTNKPASTGAFSAPPGFTPIASWSSKSGTAMPSAMSSFMGGANIPNTGNPTADFQQLMQNTGYKVGGAPSLQLAQQGAMHDWLSLNQAQQDTAKRNAQFFDQAMAGMSESQKQLSTPSPAWDKAYKFQQQLSDQTTADKADIAKQGKAAEAKYNQQMGNVAGIYNAAANTVTEGRDRISSEMAAGMRQNYDLQRDQMQGNLASQGISPDQMAEADRQSKWEMERGVGANVSNIQAQSAQAVANIQQAKAGTLASMAGTQANLSTTVMQLGWQAATAKQDAIKLGVQIAIANAQDDQQRAQLSAQYRMAMGEFGASWLANNPIMATMFSGLINQLGTLSATAGGSALVDNAANMNDRAYRELQTARSNLTGGGYGNYGMNFDFEQMIMNGMNVPGVSREVQQWIRQNGMPSQQIYGAAGGAGRMGYAEGMAPRGMESTVGQDTSYGRGGFNQGLNTDIGSSRRK